MARKSRNRAQSRAQESVATTLTPPSASSAANSGTLLGYSLILAFAVSILYFPITHHSFVRFDDEVYIFENPNIQSGLNFATIRWAFSSFYAANWHPLTWLAHAFNVELFGLDPGSHHLVSLLLHAANVVLLFLVLNFAFRAPGRCFFVAALFALHPANVESVAWAAELKSLLCTFFSFLTIGAYIRYARQPSVVRFLSVLIGFALALLAKPMAVTLPFVFLLLDYWPLSRFVLAGGGYQELAAPVSPPRSAVQLIVEKLPLLALTIVSSWITVRGQSAAGATALVHPSFALRVANATVSYAVYLRELFLPIHLAPFYPFPVGGLPAWQVLLSAIILLTISALVFYFARQRGYLAVGWLWFLGTLVPVIGLLQVGAQSRADRYLYFPMIGILLVVVWCYDELLAKRPAALRLASAVLVLGVLFVLGSRQISYWENSLVLWPHTIEVTGDNSLAERNLANDLMRANRPTEAYPHAFRAIALEPADWGSHNYVGVYYLSNGRPREAIAEFKGVIEHSTDPNLLLAALVDSGSAYSILGDLGSAEACYRRALVVSPNNPEALTGLKNLERTRAAQSPPRP